MKIFSIITAILLFYSQQLYALGGGGMGYRDGLFWGNDLNRDEYLSLEEAKGIYNLGNPEVFAKYDKNHDGLLIKFEFYDYLAERTDKE